MKPRSQVIILNGIGSVGKSSTARALQAIASKPFLHVSMDVYLDMMPEKLLAHRDGLLFESEEIDGKPLIRLKIGPILERTLRGMRHSVAAMAAQGNNIILDEVILQPEIMQEYRYLLKPFDLWVVGLFAPLDVLETREQARGDRELGLARWQYERVHKGITYDLTLDTTEMTSKNCAILIQDRFGL